MRNGALCILLVLSVDMLNLSANMLNLLDENWVSWKFDNMLEEH